MEYQEGKVNFDSIGFKQSANLLSVSLPLSFFFLFFFSRTPVVVARRGLKV